MPRNSSRTQVRQPGPRARKRRIRYAVAGLGHIAQAAVLPAFAHAANSELVALISGEEKKLRALGRRYGVDRLYAYDELERCLYEGGIDALYICLPNHLHREYAERAAAAGIHVLCEKPLAVTPLDCESMIRAADQHGVKLMTAYRLHFERASLTAAELVASDRIGEARVFSSVFTMPVREQNIRNNPEYMGGGPIFDIGIYCINAARMLFRAEPVEVMAIAHDRDTVQVAMKFPEGRIGSFTCSFDAAAMSEYTVVGTRGSLRMAEAYGYAGEKRLEITVGGRTTSRKFGKRDQFASELVYFSDCILHDLTPEPSGFEGMLDILIIDAIRRSLETGMPVPMSLPGRQLRPTLVQEIRRPAVLSEPPLVDAESPSRKAA